MQAIDFLIPPSRGYRLDSHPKKYAFLPAEGMRADHMALEKGQKEEFAWQQRRA